MLGSIQGSLTPEWQGLGLGCSWPIWFWGSCQFSSGVTPAGEGAAGRSCILFRLTVPVGVTRVYDQGDGVADTWPYVHGSPLWCGDGLA